mmetsp:Transcript_19247/g.28477  ORF Transcript_19247/g.28477 Transcript_19247/m.28477 type:complete len:251 (+) Transcript_19247:64-816(+)
MFDQLPMKFKLPGNISRRQKRISDEPVEGPPKMKYIFTVEVPLVNSDNSASTDDFFSDIANSFSLNQTSSNVSSLTTNSSSTWSSSSSESTDYSQINMWQRQNISREGVAKFFNGFLCSERVESLNAAWYLCSTTDNPKEKYAFTGPGSLAEKYQKMYLKEDYNFKTSTIRNRARRYQSSAAAIRHRKTNRRRSRQLNESLQSGVEDEQIMTLKYKYEKKRNANKVVKKVVDQVRSSVERRKKVHRLSKI